MIALHRVITEVSLREPLREPLNGLAVDLPGNGGT